MICLRKVSAGKCLSQNMQFPFIITLNTVRLIQQHFYPLCKKKITPKTQERYFTPKRRDLKRVKNQFSLHDIPVHFLGSKCLSTYICNTVAHRRHLDAFELPVVPSRAC